MSLISIADKIAEPYRTWATMEHASAGRPDPRRTRVACVGDSITFGAGVFWTRRRDAYPAQLQRLLGNEYQVMNYGFSGRTLQDEGDLPYRAEKLYQDSLACRAHTYLVMLGTNDAKPFNWDAARYEAQLEAFLAGYQKVGERVAALTPPSCFVPQGAEVVPYEIDPEAIAVAADTVRRVAKKLELPVVDLHEATAGRPELFEDGVHPLAQGNAVIAQAVYDQLF